MTRLCVRKDCYESLLFDTYQKLLCLGGGGDRGSGNPLENHKNIGFLSNAGPDPLKNHKATKPAFDFGPLSARQRNAIEMAFRWRADDGPHIVVFVWIVSPL